MKVLIVGAGHNGLVAAVHLARGGADVTVLEHSPRPGGACSSAASTLPGFVHDHCAGFNPMTVASPAMRELELEREGVEWITPPVVMAHPFADGSAIALHRDVGATAASLDAASPGAGAAWSAFVARNGPHTDRLVQTIIGALPPVGPPAALTVALRRDVVELGRLLLGSVEATGLDVFDGARRPAAWLASSAMHAGLPPTATLSGAFGILLQLLAHDRGWPFPRGGQGSITQALARMAERDGARIRCDAHVDRIVVRRGRAAGVVLRGGEELDADAVLTTVSARPLHAMLPEYALPERLLRRLRIWRYGTAAFKVDYALSGPVPWTAEPARRAAVVQVAGELEDLATAADASNRGETPQRPALVVGQHTLYDPSRAPEGGHTLYVYAHVPSSVSDDEAVAQRVEDQLERFAPGWGSLVLGRRVRGPRLTEEENPSLVGGDLAGGSYELDQQLVFRPAPELCRTRTPLRGLYVTGASVHPGGAIHGMGGRTAARALLADATVLGRTRRRVAGAVGTTLGLR